jgi:hypothetical protein
MAKKNPYEVAARKSRDTMAEALTEELERLEALLRKYEPLVQQRNATRAALRAITGGTRTTGEGTNQLRQQDLVMYLSENPGSTTREIADGVGESDKINKVSNALARGRGERFLKHDNRWWNRDPKSGLNTEEDLPPQESEDDDED